MVNKYYDLATSFYEYGESRARAAMAGARCCTSSFWLHRAARNPGRSSGY